ncbi:MAG TPA: protein kinase [Planctomycetota bacterium]|nr:protein kinase [Planctomycetota bacterium]
MKVPTGHPSPDADEVEEMIFLYLEEREQGVVATYEEFARRHTGSSAVVRERIEALERAGLVGESAGDVFPERLGSFRLIERLGGGGMGVVYLAEEANLGRKVALKLIRPEQIYFPQAKERFRREVEAIAKLSHPGIIQIFSFAEENGVPFFAMEHVEGASLGDVLRQFTGRDPTSLSGRDLASAVSAHCGVACPPSVMFDGNWLRACLEIGRQVALALAHAHERGVVHRDIKPSNVMITPDGRARLLDFGLATRSGASKLTKTGAQLGSLPYMPPELVGGQNEDAGAQTDVYSLGATLHEALALSLPFRGDSVAAMVQRIESGQHESLRQRNPQVSIDAETICNVAMDTDPKRRYATAAAMAADLACVLERRPIAARRTAWPIRAQRWMQRNPASAAASVLAALVLVGGPLGYASLQMRAAEKERGLNSDLRLANDTVHETNKSLQAAKGELETKNADLANALSREKEETARAERSLKTALDAINKTLAAVGSDSLREVPSFGPVRQDLLDRARKLYLGLLKDDPDNIDVQRELARISRAIADVLDDLGKPQLAMPEYEKAVEMSRRMIVADPDSVNTRHMLASNLMQLAKKQHQMGDLASVRVVYEEVVPIAERLLNDAPDNPRFNHDMASCLLNLGGIYLAEADVPRALAQRDRAVEVMRPALAREPEGVDFIVQMARCLNGLSLCEAALKQKDKCRGHLREAWTLCIDGLALHPTAREMRLVLIEVAVNYGLELTTSDPAEAEAVMTKGLEVGRLLVDDFPEDFQARNGLASVASNLGYHLTNQSRWREAEEALEESVLHGEALVELDGARIDFRLTLGTAVGSRSIVQLGLGRLEEARADAERGVEIFRQLRRSLGSHPLVLAGCAACLMERAEVERAEGDWRKAVASTEEALALGAVRSDIAFQAFETYWHIARVAGASAELESEERAKLVEDLIDNAMDQLESTIEQGFDDVKRLQTLADYEGLRENPRFQDLVFELAESSK